MFHNGTLDELKPLNGSTPKTGLARLFSCFTTTSTASSPTATAAASSATADSPTTPSAKTDEETVRTRFAKKWNALLNKLGYEKDATGSKDAIQYAQRIHKIFTGKDASLNKAEVTAAFTKAIEITLTLPYAPEENLTVSLEQAKENSDFAALFEETQTLINNLPTLPEQIAPPVKFTTESTPKRQAWEEAFRRKEEERAAREAQEQASASADTAAAPAP